MATRIVWASGVMFAACTSAEPIAPPACSTTRLDLGNVTCVVAQELVSRDSAQLAPLQVDLDRYAALWQRAADVEPVLATSVAGAARYLDDGVIVTTNPAVIAAWQVGQVATGDAAFDALMQQAGAAFVGPDGGGANGAVTFAYSPYGVFNETIFRDQLATTETTLGTSDHDNAPDAMLTWLNSDLATGTNDATAQLAITLAWGVDCGFAGCTESHALRAVVPPTGDAIVYDLGGDPIALDPRTRPQ